MTKRVFLTFLCAALPCVADPAPLVKLLSNVWVIGASASAGFNHTEPMGGKTTPQYALHRHLREACLARTGVQFQTGATGLFFMNPREAVRQQMEKIRGQSPASLVVAVDFLFWHCYGRSETEAARLTLLERGLEVLADLKMPLILGDLPNAAAAAGPGKMLSEASLPQSETLDKANARIAEWAKERSNVAVLPMSAFMKACLANAELTFGPSTWAAGSTRQLLQADGLHPTRHGASALALAVWAAAVEKGWLTQDSVEWTSETVYKRVVEPKRPPPAASAESK
jgi:hypothetical protein